MLALADDERLAALAAGGSERAFGELVQRHEARLLMVSRSVLRSDEDARDAVQNALLKAFRALQEGQLRGAPRPWLARIAHNEARSLARARREFTPLDPESLGVSGDPHELILARERLAALVADIAALPDRLRQPLLLRAEAGLSYDAIARSLGTTAGAARQAVCDARAALSAEAAAREADCLDIRTILTGPDRRRHRSRRVRGHLRACVACRAWRPERRTLALLPGGGVFWSVAQWLNTLFTAGAGSVAGAARSTAMVVAVSAGSLTLATDRPPRSLPRLVEAPGQSGTPVVVATATPDTVTLQIATPTAPPGDELYGAAAAVGGGEAAKAGGGESGHDEPSAGGDPEAQGARGASPDDGREPASARGGAQWPGGDGERSAPDGGTSAARPGGSRTPRSGGARGAEGPRAARSGDVGGTDAAAGAGGTGAARSGDTRGLAKAGGSSEAGGAGAARFGESGGMVEAQSGEAGGAGAARSGETGDADGLRTAPAGETGGQGTSPEGSGASQGSSLGGESRTGAAPATQDAASETAPAAASTTVPVGESPTA